jgi:hypothetical protein
VSYDDRGVALRSLPVLHGGDLLGVLVVQERKTGRVGVAVVRPGGRVELLGLGKDPAIEGAHGVKLVREFREKATGVYVSTPTVGKTFRFEGDRSVPVKE